MDTLEEAQFMFNHVFLPPKPPDRSDDDRLASTFFTQLLSVSESFSKNLDRSHQQDWNTVMRSLQRWENVHTSDGFSQESALNHIQRMGSGETLLLNVRSQNAAILLCRGKEGTVLHAFEISPTTDAVLNSQGALQRDFPAKSVFISNDILHDRDFMETLVSHLHRLAQEQTNMSLESAVKAGVKVQEVRQTEHPHLVTQWLFALLAARGGRPTAPISIHKRMRDEVSWVDTLKPWRRSSSWISIKSSLQLMLEHLYKEKGRSIYKLFMMVFMCHLTKSVIPLLSSLDNLHVMREKLARRNAKLDSAVPFHSRKYFEQAILTVKKHMDAIWDNVRSSETTAMPTLAIERLEREVSLSKSGRAFRDVLARYQSRTVAEQDCGSITSSLAFSFNQAELPAKSAFLKPGDDEVQTLLACNHWVEFRLATWSEAVRPEGSVCMALYDLMITYFKSARSAFRQDSELMSTAILVLLELWVALDTLTLMACPMLKDFSPEVPYDIFHPLKLSRSKDLHRLAKIEVYLEKRHASKSARNPSIFDKPGANTFGVQFYQESKDLQALHDAIETQTVVQKAEILQEYRNKRKEYEEKIRAAQEIPRCEKMLTDYGFRHDPKCKKCWLIRSANRLTVHKFEEPLPENTWVRSAVIFELQPPEQFVAWRDATHFLLQDLFRVRDNPGLRVKVSLATYQALNSYHKHPTRRVGLGSEYKPFHESHYIRAEVTTTLEEELFMPHGLRHSFQDSQKLNLWLQEQEVDYSLTHFCRPKIISGPYVAVFETLLSSNHSQNGVIARQARCPASLSIHEFVAFGSMRCGDNLQLLNMLRSLRAQEIDLNSESVVLLFETILHEVGHASENSGDFLRTSHQELRNSSFCEALLATVESRLEIIESNWKEVSSMRCCLLITQRVASFSDASSTVVFQTAFRIIKRIRRTALQWTIQLAERSIQARQKGAPPSEINELQRKVLDSALLTRSTWNSDAHFRSLFLSDDSNVSQYVTTCIMISDYGRLCHGDKDPALRRQMLKDQITALEIEVYLRNHLQNLGSAITAGINTCWKALDIEPTWTLAHGPQSLWIASKLVGGKPVHFHVLTGALLVAGRPISVLPNDYAESPIYKQVFGDTTVDVIASDLPWMDFMTASLIEDTRVYFGASSGEHIIQAVHNDSTYEALLRRTFGKELPVTIIGRTQPWLCLNNGHVQLRDSSKQWNPEHKHWSISPSKNFDDLHVVNRNRQYLVDSTGVFGRAVCKIFQGFEDVEFLEIVYEDGTGLKVEMPRYHLTFSLQPDTGRLRCVELAADVDSDTSVGCFYGLKSRLMLSSIHASDYDKKRYMLIPYGPLSISAASDHVETTIDTKEQSVVKFFQYKIDNNLGQVDADGNLESHLFKILLHATTGSCLEDPLTGRTGVTEAIAAIRDTIALTSVPMTRTATDILKNILELTPVREFYPDSKTRILQTIRWHPVLPFSAQHNAFSQFATDLATHSVMANFLYNAEKYTVPEYRGDHHLRERALKKEFRYFPVYPTCPVLEPAAMDVVYRGRDRDHGTNQVIAYRVGASVLSWSVSGPVMQDLYQMMENFEHVSGFSDDFSPVNISDLLKLDMKVAWPALMTTCLMATRANMNTLAMELSLMSFGNPALEPEIRTLAALLIHDPLKAIGPIENLSYDLTVGNEINTTQLAPILKACRLIDAKSLLTLEEQTHNGIDIEAELSVELQLQEAFIHRAVRNAWQSASVDLSDQTELSLFDTEPLTEMLEERLVLWRNNRKLYEQCMRYKQQLESINLIHCQRPMPSFNAKHQKVDLPTISHSAASTQWVMPSLLKAFCGFDPSTWADHCPKLTSYDESIHSRFAKDIDGHESQDTTALESLRGLIDRLHRGNEPEVRLMSRDLSISLQALEEHVRSSNKNLEMPERGFIQREFTLTQGVVQAFLQGLEHALIPHDAPGRGFRAAGLWPSIEVRSLLQLLQPQNREQLSQTCQDVLFELARAVSAKQRLARMLHFLFVQDSFALRREVENDAHASWDIRKHPDWLLLEIQNDFLIRPTQVLVAKEIIRPRNGVVQLGMGEGKTSVILPMAITALSNGEHLVRVTVLKSLATEMLRSLSRNLSGLVNRPIYYLPFSRGTTVNQEVLTALSVIRNDCKDRKGALLALPEHLNSFRLMANDKVVAREHGIRERMLGTQKGLDANAVDILDEADEILHPRNELVYTSGTPKPLSGSPARWNTLLEILTLIEANIGQVVALFPSSIDYSPVSVGSFPRVRILKADGYECLQSLILQDIRKGAISSLPLDHYSHDIIDLAILFIQDLTTNVPQRRTLQNKIRKRSEIQCLHLLRGMFALGNLKAALERRWFVNYGLDRSRSLAGVPYRAKSTPATAAEFAQPDMMILFTSLSYFYAGISLEDLRYCLALLVRSTNSVEEYHKWTRTTDVPVAYRNVHSLNAESDMCVEHLFTTFRMNKTVISFFLKRVVFPREAKEYPQKLCSSAWDLCSEGPKRFVSGFSGTCDVLMPLTMPKQDIQGLKHYDAAVLFDLLKDRNQLYIYAGDDQRRRLDTDSLLRIVSRDALKPDVLIDVGAQLEDVNYDVARRWLTLRHDGKMACVFFNDDNEKTVISRDGTVTPWKSSPYREQVDKCLIFLDEFHTRGTDFQLPDKFTGAMLLGPRLSKDNLVQAAMRLRKLSSSQSIVTIGNPEVDDSIRTILNLSDTHVISMKDVVEWSIHQSCFSREQQRPLLVDRGLAYLQRSQAFDKLVNPSGSLKHQDSYIRAILQDESHDVTKLYASFNDEIKTSVQCPYKIDMKTPISKELMKEWHNVRSQIPISCFQEQEQEREILHEVEQEREVERPDSMNAQRVRLNEELHQIIVSNRIVRVKPESLQSAFDVLQHTTLRGACGKSQWPPYLLATDDFLYPVKIADGSDLDDFLRPVHWLLILKGLPHIILISGHEAHAWKDDIKISTVATLVMYHPRLRLEAGSFDLLNVYQLSGMPDITRVDAKARTALRLFAGQLYFNNFQEYTEFCLLVGLWDGKMNLKEHMGAIGENNYVPTLVRAVTSGWTGKWKKNPVETIKRLIGMRRANEEWDHTHVGRVLNGQLLTKEDFLPKA